MIPSHKLDIHNAVIAHRVRAPNAIPRPLLVNYELSCVNTIAATMARDTCQNRSNHASGVGVFASGGFCVRGRDFLHQGFFVSGVGFCWIGFDSFMPNFPRKPYTGTCNTQIFILVEAC